MDATVQEHSAQQQQQLQQHRDSQDKLLSEAKQQLQCLLEAAAESDTKLQAAQQQLQQQQQHLQQLTQDLQASQATNADTLTRLTQKKQAQHELHLQLQALQQDTNVLRQRLSQDQRQQLPGEPEDGLHSSSQVRMHVGAYVQ